MYYNRLAFHTLYNVVWCCNIFKCLFRLQLNPSTP